MTWKTVENVKLIQFDLSELFAINMCSKLFSNIFNAIMSFLILIEFHKGWIFRQINITLQPHVSYTRVGSNATPTLLQPVPCFIFHPSFRQINNSSFSQNDTGNYKGIFVSIIVTCLIVYKHNRKSIELTNEYL